MICHGVPPSRPAVDAERRGLDVTATASRKAAAAVSPVFGSLHGHNGLFSMTAPPFSVNAVTARSWAGLSPPGLGNTSRR